MTGRPGSGVTGREAAAGRRRMGLATATGLVIASMVGTGAFTTTGLLVEVVPSAGAALACWGVAGIVALCGALCYAELGAAMPHNGGEYRFLSQLFHPGLGFLSAWVSLIVGFAAPLAAVALAFGEYARAFTTGVDPRLVGAVLIVALSLVNAWRVTAGAGVQNALTYGKLVLIAAFVVAGAWVGRGRFASWANDPPLLQTMATPGFAVGLLLVSFSYFGWNAAAYVAGEVRDPARVMPRSLLLGTGAVLLLYLALNAVFLAAAPLSALAGRVEVGHVAAVGLLGPTGGRVLSAVIALGLLSTVGALIVTGPRVYEAVGEDLPPLRWLARRREGRGPGRAILLQSGLALAMLGTAGFETLLGYIGFTLSVFSALTVLGVFRLRRGHRPLPFRTPGHPVTPLLFVAVMGWTVIETVLERPLTAAYGAATVLVGLAVYLATVGGRTRRPGIAASAAPGTAGVAAKAARDDPRAGEQAPNDRRSGD